MFKVDEEFFDLELDDDFFQDAFNVTSKTSTQQPSSVVSTVLSKQSGLDHSAALKDNHHKLSEVQGDSECNRTSACASDGPSKVHGSVLQNEINLATDHLDKTPPSSIIASKHCPPDDCALTDTREELSSDHMDLQPCRAATSVTDVCVDNGLFPKTSMPMGVKSGNQKKLSFISYDEGEDFFSFESIGKCFAVSDVMEKSARHQQSVSSKCTQQESNFSGKKLPFSVLKCASPLLKKKTASDTSGDCNSSSLLHYNISKLERTDASAMNMLTVNLMNNELDRPLCVQKTPTLHKSVSPFNDVSSRVINSIHLNQSTPRNKSTSITRKRKFPGPAGILPELPPGADLSALSEPESPIVSVSPKDAAPQDFVCSQSLVDEFEKEPWQMMLKDVACEGSSSSIMDNFNISSVLQQANSKQLPKGKVPVLCIILKNISLQGSEARVTFADRTGEMSGMIHGKVLEEYQDKLQPGAVLVLKQVTVFSPSARKHYLVITPSNIISLYGVLGNKTSVISYSGSELMAMAEEWVQEVARGPRISPGNMQLLFSNSSCLKREAPSPPHVGPQRSNNSAQQSPGENFSPKQTSFAARTSLSSKENQKDNIVLHNLVTDESYTSLNSGPCSSRNKMSPQTVIACSIDVQMAGTMNSSTPDCVEQSITSRTVVSETGGCEDESAVFEDEFDDLFSSLDEEALLSEKW